MARIAGTASLGMKVALGHKKAFGNYDNASPHHSITIERQVDENLSDEELAEKASELNSLARKLVEQKINDDLQEIQQVD